MWILFPASSSVCTLFSPDRFYCLNTCKRRHLNINQSVMMQSLVHWRQTTLTLLLFYEHIVLCRHFTHVSFGQIHIRCCRRFVFNILTFLLRPNWPTTAALISPSITPQSVTLPQHAVCVQVWLFLHFRAEKSPFFEC